MPIAKKHPSSARRQDAYDERETSPLPTLSEALIIAVAALVALVALYEIHDSLDRVGQVVTPGDAIHVITSPPPLAEGARRGGQTGKGLWHWDWPRTGMH